MRPLRPAGPASPVVIDPLVRFGRPVLVDGVATERLWELFDAGETVGAADGNSALHQLLRDHDSGTSLFLLDRCSTYDKTYARRFDTL